MHGGEDIIIIIYEHDLFTAIAKVALKAMNKLRILCTKNQCMYFMQFQNSFQLL
jgi:hypothetical protein